MLKNLEGCCSAVVSLVKPPRCWETLEVAAVVVLNRIYLILGWTGNFWKGWKLSKSEGFAKAEIASMICCSRH
ncbi:MAG: hypothetical protein GDA51_08365 [Ekhidna sp.]|nr:hypothetical protein [Ekhidna sp.]